MQRGLRERNAVCYFPKPQFFNVVTEPSAIAGLPPVDDPSLLIEHNASNGQPLPDDRNLLTNWRCNVVISRKLNRECLHAVPCVRSQLTKARGQQQHAVLIAPNQLTIAVQIIPTCSFIWHRLATEMIKMKGALEEKDKKIGMLMKQDSANQKMIATMAKINDEKDVQLEHLERQLQDALDNLGNFCKLRIFNTHQANYVLFSGLTGSFLFSAIMDESRVEYDTNGDPLQFEASALLSSLNGTMDTTIDSTNDATIDNTNDGTIDATIDIDGTSEIVVAEVYHSMDSDSEPEYYNLEWLEESKSD